MRLTVEWEHTPEKDWDLEQWVADVQGVQLRVAKLPTTISTTDSRQFIWSNNLTGTEWRTDAEDTLEAAMLSAIKSVTERNNNDGDY